MKAKKTPAKKLYMIHVWGDVDPHLHGPYKTAEARDKAVLAVEHADTDMPDTLLKLDISAKGVPSVRPWSGKEMDKLRGTT